MYAGKDFFMREKPARRSVGGPQLSPVKDLKDPETENATVANC